MKEFTLTWLGKVLAILGLGSHVANHSGVLGLRPKQRTDIGHPSARTAGFYKWHLLQKVLAKCNTVTLESNVCIITFSYCSPSPTQKAGKG